MPLLTPKQLSQELGISERTIRRYIARGKLPVYRLPSGVPRFELSKVLAALERKKSNRPWSSN